MTDVANTIEAQLLELKNQYKFAENVITGLHAANKELQRQVEDLCVRNANQLKTISELQDENDDCKRQIGLLKADQCKCGN